MGWTARCEPCRRLQIKVQRQPKKTREREIRGNVTIYVIWYNISTVSQPPSSPRVTQPSSSNPPPAFPQPDKPSPQPSTPPTPPSPRKPLPLQRTTRPRVDEGLLADVQGQQIVAGFSPVIPPPPFDPGRLPTSRFRPSEFAETMQAHPYPAGHRDVGPMGWEGDRDWSQLSEISAEVGLTPPVTSRAPPGLFGFMTGGTDPSLGRIPLLPGNPPVRSMFPPSTYQPPAGHLNPALQGPMAGQESRIQEAVARTERDGKMVPPPLRPMGGSSTPGQARGGSSRATGTFEQRAERHGLRVSPPDNPEDIRLHQIRRHEQGGELSGARRG
ncbi:hypothetical protein EJ04DRAFT_589305 [Polyplosphaeria fusca]|uniref:Uncharacterized protein n=1 Tax=Polyplosphaeria fusca TaxID=682080 RepID=A0A9P4UUW2_9PLEO|nr:hypothetical protein EJ04DRAFT_589305 [Polyplosphaeria fusca]